MRYTQDFFFDVYLRLKKPMNANKYADKKLKNRAFKN